jgi:MoxR-like ATPase
VNDCKDCPAYLSVGTDISARLGKFAGAPVCGRYGHYLGAPGDSDGKTEHSTQIRRHFATECESYGVPLTDTEKSRIHPNQHVTLVAMPTRNAAEHTMHAEKLRNCNACENFIGADIAFEQSDLTVPVCGARGSLIYDTNVANKDCGWAKAGKDSNPRIRLRKPYQPGFRVKDARAVETFVSASGGAIEPTEYPTDKDVTEDDIKFGVRAWRKVTDPDTGKFGYLPIWNRELFTEAELATIPQTGDKGHPELYVDYSGVVFEFMVESWTLDEILCLVSKPGLGKTEGLRYVAWLMQMPFDRFSFDHQTEKDDWMGGHEYVEGRGTEYVLGRIAAGYTRPRLSVADEFNLARGDAREGLRSAFDSARQLVADAAHGIVLDRDPRQRFTIAINPAWDANNLGTEELAQAEIDRMSFSTIDYPPEDVERGIIHKRIEVLDGVNMSESDMDMLMGIAKDMRAANDEGSFPFSWGIRQQIKVARKLSWYKPMKAYEQAVLNYLDPEIAEIAKDHIRNHAA